MALASLSKATSLVTLDRIPKLERARVQGGHYVPVPTNAEIFRRHQQQKAWFVARDLLIAQFQAMADLQSPFRNDKDGLADAGYVDPNNRTLFATATFPFDTLTLLISNMADRHPYVNASPVSLKQSDKQVEQTEKFCQAVLDNKMTESLFLKDAMKYLATSGWLCVQHAYNPTLGLQGEFPYDIQIVNPLQVYPMLDERRRPIWVTIEKRVTGAELLQDYAMYPGVAELINDEPDEDQYPVESGAYRDRQQPGNSFLTTEFVVIRYFDDSYTALLLDASGAKIGACQYNPTLARYQKDSKAGKYMNVLYGSAHSTDPYAGVLEHHLGGIPMQFVWCWPESRNYVALSSTITTNPTSWAGRYIGLPFLFSQYENWKSMCRLLSQYHTIMLRAADPQYYTTADNLTPADLNSKLVHLSNQEDIKQVPQPPMPVEVDKLMQMIQQEIDRGTFAPAAYGARAGTSGRQQGDALEVGTVRMNTISGEIERACEKTLTGIIKTMIERGDEELVVSGQGAKYDGPYVTKYAIGSLATPPRLEVQLLAKKAFITPDVIAILKSAQGILPMEEALRTIAGVPNPKAWIEKLRDEAIMQMPQSVAPYATLKQTQEQTELAQTTAKAQFELEQAQKKADLWKRQQEIALRAATLAPEALEAKAEQALQQLAQQLIPNQQQPPQQPGQGQQPSMSMQSPSGPPPGADSSPGSPSMPPGTPPNSPPPPLAGPSGTPSNGNLPPMPTGGAMPMPVSRPPLPMPPPNLLGGGPIAKAPGQAQQPIQPLSRMQPPGGVGRPGVDSLLVGPQGLPAQPSPAIMAANRAVAAPTLGAAVPTLGQQRNGRPTRRGSRGKGGKR